jgi:hypothetical protein
MGNTLTVRLPAELADWLRATAEQSGIPAGRIVRQQIERARAEGGNQMFLRHAGRIEGPADLASRKGFSRR